MILKRIRVRIDPPHPLLCRKRRLNGAVLRMRPGKPEAPCHSRCGPIKIPPCSKALSAEHRPKAFTGNGDVSTSEKFLSGTYKTVNNQSHNQTFIMKTRIKINFTTDDINEDEKLWIEFLSKLKEF
jgi:hypothetical protein